MCSPNKKLSEPLQTILAIDESLYGVDEVLAFSIVNIRLNRLYELRLH